MGFETIKIEAPEGGALPKLLAPEMRRVLYALDLKAAAGAKLRQAVAVLRNFVGTFRITVGEIEFGIEPAPGKADTGNLQQDLPMLMLAIAEAAAEKNSAIGLFLDEVQYLSADELAAVIVGCHELS